MAAKSKVTGLTAQQEKFAREYVRLGSGAAAYRLAYNVRPGTKPESVWQAASRLLDDPKVRSRVDALLAKAAEKATVTRASMLFEMEQNRELAISLDNPSAAQSASRDRAKVAGLLKETVEHTGKDGAAIEVREELAIEDRSRNDIARRIAFLLRKGAREAAAAAKAVNTAEGDAVNTAVNTK